MKVSRMMLTLVILACSLASPAQAAFPGGIYQFAIPEGAHTVRFQDRPVLQITGQALIGIPISTPPGNLELTYQTGGGADSQTHRHSFAVVDKTYTEQHITIENQDLVSPPPETQARISEEAVRQRKLYRAYQPQHSLTDGFKQPLQGIITSLFGHRRFFNGQPRNPHSGLDIAADTGTPIDAAGSGVVTLADDLYFNGNTVFIDHGQGLITMYCHMSRIDVEAGQRVQLGDTIGAVGATGRVTGPHLHWSVSLNGTRIDPQHFVSVVNQLLSSEATASGA